MCQMNHKLTKEDFTYKSNDQVIWSRGNLSTPQSTTDELNDHPMVGLKFRRF